MTDHPQATRLDRLADGFKEDAECIFGQTEAEALAEENAVKAGAAALRALAQFRPHHPSTVVGSRYVVLVVPYQAWLDAKKAVGDHDLGPIDLEALRAAHDRDRQGYFDEMGAEALRDKWGSSL